MSQPAVPAPPAAHATYRASDLSVAADVSDRVCALGQVDMSFAAVLDRSGTTFRVGQLAGNRTSSLRDIVSSPGTGVGGRCIARGRPVAVTDYGSARDITHHFDAAVAAEGLHAVFAVPLRIGGQVRGAIYGALREPARFPDRLVQAAGRVADVPAVPAGPAGGAEPDAVYRDRLQQAYLDLRAILPEVTDPVLRAQLRRVSEQLVARPGEHAGESAPTVGLSPRELDVLCAAAMGCANREIAERLSLTPSTVKAYLRSAMTKLDSHNRTDAIRVARLHGLLP